MIKNYFANSRLEYLDSILKELAKNMGSFISEDTVAPLVSFRESKHKVFGSMITTKEGIPVGKERMVFRTATIYLENEGLIMRKEPISETPDYMITFKGLELIEKGGLLKRSNNDKLKEVLQKLVWLFALLTFGVNTFFQILNYYSLTSKKSYQIDQQSVQAMRK